MIVSFKHRGLERFFRTGSKAGIQPVHARKLTDMLTILDLAREIATLDAPGWDLHPLKGNLAGQWSIKVNGNWRLTFRFDGKDVHVLDYQDYH